MSQQNKPDELAWLTDDWTAKVQLVSNLYRLGIISKATYQAFELHMIYG